MPVIAWSDFQLLPDAFRAQPRSIRRKIPGQVSFANSSALEELHTYVHKRMGRKLE